MSKYTKNEKISILFNMLEETLRQYNYKISGGGETLLCFKDTEGNTYKAFINRADETDAYITIRES